MDEASKNIIKSFTVDMIKDEIWRDLAEDIGLDNFCKVLSHIGGMQVYVPRLDRMLIPARDKLIKKEFDGSNFAFLSKKYALSERAVREIIAEGQIPGQISLDEIL